MKKDYQNALKFLDIIIESQIKHPEITPDRVLILELKSKTIEKIFTPGRKNILEIIKNKSPKTVGDIARLTNRPVESVSRDLKILQNYGIIELLQNGQTKKPMIEKDLLMIPL